MYIGFVEKKYYNEGSLTWHNIKIRILCIKLKQIKYKSNRNNYSLNYEIIKNINMLEI